MKDFLTKLDAGEAVITTDRYNDEAVEYVKRTTPTLVLLGDGGEFHRYRKINGYATGRGMFCRSIERKATPREVKLWKEKEAANEAAEQSFKRREARRVAKRKALSGLLPEGVWVAESGVDSKFNLQHLTEAQVRRVSAVLKGK